MRNVTKGRVIRTRSIIPKLSFEELVELNELGRSVQHMVTIFYVFDGQQPTPAYLILPIHEVIEIRMDDPTWVTNHIAYTKVDALTMLLSLGART